MAERTPLPRQYPNLNGMNLPTPLIEAVQQIYQRFYDLRDASQPAIASIAPNIIQDVHANRILHPPGPLPLGSIYIETDRGLTYINRFVSSTNAWVYLEGTFQQTQSQVAALVATLGVNDTGLLLDVTDYAHVLRWTGTVFTFQDPADIPGRIVGFLVDPFPTTGWHVCDGSMVSQLLPDGTLFGPYAIPNLTGTPGYLKFGPAASPAVNSPVAPTLTMNPYTPAGTNSTVSFTPAGTNSTPVFTGTPQTFGDVAQGAGALTAHSTPNPYTPAGTVSAPTFTGSAGTVPAETFTGTPATLTGTISTTGEPSNVELKAWIRL